MVGEMMLIGDLERPPRLIRRLGGIAAEMVESNRHPERRYAISSRRQLRSERQRCIARRRVIGVLQKNMEHDLIRAVIIGIYSHQTVAEITCSRDAVAERHQDYYNPELWTIHSSIRDV